ncbi:polymeric immunoglobulin receptor-like isoform X3 [Anguilla rostrata]|uniref:polymeric immunoglobulin receptor-like isoform X3 n=1 Tax=Anguilla rostrata TaxID=7938 RepID=UPI0030D00AED
MATTQLLFLSIIFLPVLPGADAVSTVSNVTVQTGRSVTIPCHYDKIYENNVKYWCRGSDWDACRTLVRTDSPEVEGETSITDDPTHEVFTVTMSKLKTEDSGYYWCYVEIDWGYDKGTRLYLDVSAESPGLWVDQQEVTGVEGGHVSVQCHTIYPSSMKKWCRAEGSCVEVNSAKPGRSEIKDNHSENVFIVMMRELNREDTGWYWCATGQLQIPVHITVFQKTTTTTVTTSADSVSTVSKVAVQSGRSVTIPCHYDKKYEKHVKYWCRESDWRMCRIVVHTDFPKVKGETSITDDPTHHVFTVTIKYLTGRDTGYYWCCVEIKGVGDERKFLYLDVTAGTPGLWVDQQEVTGVEGGHASVQCHTNYPSSMKKWCRAEGSCVTVNSAKSGRSEIKDDRSENVFIVTMRELNREDAGWYWCAAGELQIPVHITVTQKTTTTTVTTTTQCVTSRALCTSLPVSTATTSATATKLSTSKMLAVTIPWSSLPPTTTYNNSALTSLERTLGPLRHTGVALVFLICSAVAFWKIWRYRIGAQHSRKNREDVGRYANNTAEPCNLLTMDVM